MDHQGSASIHAFGRRNAKPIIYHTPKPLGSLSIDNGRRAAPQFLGFACKEGKGRNYPILSSQGDPPSKSYFG
jgi:hypothetical protein